MRLVAVIDHHWAVTGRHSSPKAGLYQYAQKKSLALLRSLLIDLRIARAHVTVRTIPGAVCPNAMIPRTAAQCSHHRTGQDREAGGGSDSR